MIMVEVMKRKAKIFMTLIMSFIILSVATIFLILVRLDFIDSSESEAVKWLSLIIYFGVLVFNAWYLKRHLYK